MMAVVMYFLAVFCGFLAEYQLEHKIERDREKEYMHSMLADLGADTVMLIEGFPRKDHRIQAIDSLLDYFSSHPKTTRVPGYVYQLMVKANFDRSYDRNSVTINQLKNSGGMRLIKKRLLPIRFLHMIMPGNGLISGDKPTGKISK